MWKMRFMSKVLLVLVLLAASSRLTRVGAATITVTTTADTGAGSLREAIGLANTTAVADTITFNISGSGVQTIALSTALPTIQYPVIIDGLTQPNADCTVWPHTLLIELDGNGIAADGLSLAATAGGSTISGLIINDFDGAGISVNGGGSSTISCNYIGTDSTGLAASGNSGDGIYLVDSPTNSITGNLISGNGGSGVYIQGSSATGNQVKGNRIGSNVDGALPLPNTGNGVYLVGAPNSQIGGLLATDRNLISGNASSGVRIDGGTALGNTVEGNYIGLQLNGIDGLGNGRCGVWLSSAPNNTIGGLTAEARNVISDNEQHGVSINNSGATGNTVQGNYIGTQADGSTGLGNGYSGVYINNAPGNTVGGVAEGARNIIADNSFHGVYIGNDGATGNVVQGNHIGTGSAGTESIGNTLHGVFMRLEASNNYVGGPSAEEANLIVHNGLDGVYLESGTGNLISGNSISENGGLGIDLAPDGNNPNDSGDVDGGANNGQNYPMLTSVSRTGGNTTIVGTLNSTASTNFNLEFFYNTSADPSGYGEGSVFIGSYGVTTDGSGNASFTAQYATVIPGDSFVSATATDPTNNTSEFSPVRLAPTAVTLSGFDAYPRLQAIVLEWTTTAEIEILGFNLYRAEQTDGLRTKLNDSLIASEVPGSLSGAHYTWQDDKVSPGIVYYYWLEDIDIHGIPAEHGPAWATVIPYYSYLPLVNR